MFVKKLDNFSVGLDNLFLYWIIFLLSFTSFGQTTSNSYKDLWKTIENDSVSNEKKIHYLEVYYKKARTENNELEQYRALEKKSYLVPFADATALLHQMHPLVQNIANDSIKGDFLNRSTVFYYDNRDFKNALYYAIESETFNEKINNPYNLNVVQITIGNIYYHTGYYDKAVTYFIQAKDYYQTKKDYNHLRGYISSLYSLSKTYWQLKDIEQLTTTIRESEQAITQLKPKDRILETAYLEYIKGGLAFLQENNAEAENHFNKALSAIKQNGDFTNEHVIYLYLGKILWNQNQKTEAATYFTKIDNLFKEKAFLNYKLREAYKYLTEYYKETNQAELQFQASESFMQLNQQFEKEQQSITKMLHEDLEGKKLKNNQLQLQKRLNNSMIWISGLGGVLVLIAAYLLWKKKTGDSRRLQSQSQVTVSGNGEEQKQSQSQSQFSVEGNNEEPSDSQEITEFQQPKPKKLSATGQRLLEGLSLFEQEKEFLIPTTLDDLAKRLNTTRSTLSPFLNEQKGGFNVYLNKLRIQQIVADLRTDKELRKKSNKELAEMYGDLHPKTFATLFKEETGENLAVFIKLLEEQEK